MIDYKHSEKSKYRNACYLFARTFNGGFTASKAWRIIENIVTATDRVVAIPQTMTVLITLWSQVGSFKCSEIHQTSQIRQHTGYDVFVMTSYIQLP